ncbi:MAG TPA: acetaldehyde dehydrogenase (acetylating) [Vicinamibacteria bacterium]|nr:acetaldehyde dehydrogenase (acetylating) [Vicinamibacteria bacterium]
MATPLESRDLRSIQEARTLAARAREAQQKTLAGFSQEQVDRVVDAMAEAARREAEPLARLAHEETGFGNVKDKTTKNLFSARDVHAYIRPLRTVGVLREDKDTGVVEIAEPMGVVAAIIPSTNPTSTAIYKALISVKARNAVVMSPHPSAQKCIRRSMEVMHQAAVGAGLPPDALTCLTEVTIEGTQELMRCRDTGVILATGGIGLVRAAYSSGKPAYGVGPGNVPAYIEKTADVKKAVRDVINGKTFDYGTLCSSEQSIVCDEAIREAVIAEVKANGGYFLSETETAAVSKVVVTPQRMANPEIVGKPAATIAEKAGIKVPPETRVLVAPLAGVGREHPLSIEKLSPVLAFYVVKDWHEGCERCLQLLRYGGTGHTLGIHSRDDAVIREFALKKPVFRIVANTQTSMGATGYTTGLAPSMSLGCGAYAGNITSDNITPLHLINIKRLAYERPRAGSETGPGAAPASSLQDKVQAFLDTRLPRASPPAAAPAASGGSARPGPAPAATAEAALDFVCEDDVRRALREGRKLRVSPRAIVTPAAADLAAGTPVLVVEGDPRR